MNKEEASKILGVPVDASPEQIKQAYKKLAKQHHPDRPTGNKEAFQRLQKAQDVMMAPPEQQMPNINFHMNGFDFSNIFRAHMRAQQGSFMFTQTVQNFDLRSILQGTAKYKDITLPNWVRHGDVLRVSQSERIVIQVSWPAGISQHRSGRHNILIKKQISLDRALLGRDVRILHPDGKPVRIKGNGDVYQSKREYCVQGEGLPDRNGDKGDMYVQFDIKMPEVLMEGERKVLSKLFPEEPMQRVHHEREVQVTNVA